MLRNYQTIVSQWTSLLTVHLFIDGRWVRIFVVVGDCTCEYLALISDISIWGLGGVARELDRPLAEHGKPNMIVSGNGNELISNAILQWANDLLGITSHRVIHWSAARWAAALFPSLAHARAAVEDSAAITTSSDPTRGLARCAQHICRSTAPLPPTRGSPTTRLQFRLDKHRGSVNVCKVSRIGLNFNEPTKRYPAKSGQCKSFSEISVTGKGHSIPKVGSSWRIPRVDRGSKGVEMR